MFNKLITVLFFICISQPVFSAVPCLITGEIEVSADGKNITAPLLLKNCTGATVLSGKGRVFLENSVGEKKSVPIKQGDKLDEVVRDQSAQGGLRAFSNVFNSIVMADPSIKGGGKRASSDVGIPGFPSSEIYVNDGPVEMNFARVPVQLLNFEITDIDANRIVFSSKGVNGKFVVPKGIMKVGREYHWIGNLTDGRVERDFRIVDEATAKDVANEISLVGHDKSLSATDKQIMISFVFEKYGLTFDRERVVSGLFVK